MPCNVYTMAYTPTLCLVFLYDTVYAGFLLWTVCHKAVETIYTIPTLTQGIQFHTQLKTVTSLWWQEDAAGATPTVMPTMK